MKLNSLTLLASAAGAMILSSHAHAAFLGLALESTDEFFSNHPNTAIRDAWNAGPVNQYDIYRLYANFDSDTESDRVNAWISTPASPFYVELEGGLFHNYVEGSGLDVVHFNGAYTGVNPIERSWDTWATIGSAMSYPVGELPGTNGLGYNSNVIGPAESAVVWISPDNSQGRAASSAPGQAPAPPGTFRVLLAQFVVTQGTTSLQGTALVNASGQDMLHQTFGIPAPIVHGDATGDKVVDIGDLLAVINAWGACPQRCSLPCSADVAPPFFGDCTIDVNDLLLVINNWTS